MPYNLFEILRQSFEATSIISDEALIFDGQTHLISSGPDNKRSYEILPIVEKLRDLFYTRCYCRTFLPRQTLPPPGKAIDHTLIETMSENIRCRVSDDQDGIISRVMPSGLFIIQSQTRTQARHQNPITPALIRVYFNLQAKGAAPFAALLCPALNKKQIPFAYKCQGHPDRYDRQDAGVLYLRAEHYPDLNLILTDLYDQIALYLKKTTPLFTKQLAAGIGLAEEPISHMSFGRHRCWRLAEGIWKAFKLGEDWERTVKRSFASHGIRLQSPYLNPASDDHYAVLTNP